MNHTQPTTPPGLLAQIADLLGGVEYRPIPHLPCYYAGADGRIVSTRSGRPYIIAPWVQRVRQYLLVKVATGPGCSSKRTRLVAHLILETFSGPRPTPEHEPDYRNGNRQDCSARNLRWVHRVGHRPACEDQGAAKLTNAQVHRIRTRCAAGDSDGDIARDMGIARCTVNQIRHRRLWRHLPERRHLRQATTRHGQACQGDRSEG